MVKKVAGNVYIYLILFLMYLPILFLMVFSFTDAPITGMWNGFTLRLYRDVFLHSKIMPALLNTLLIASVSALIATLLGTLGAIGVFYMKKRPKQVFETVNEIPVVNADVVIAISLALLFKITVDSFANIGITLSNNNFVTLLIGHVVLTISFVYLNVKPKLQQMDPNDYEAALDLGAKPMLALVKVVIPAILPGIISGFMLAFTLSLDDFIITSFLRDKSFDTLSTYVQGVIVKSTIPAELRALTSYIFLVTSLIVVANGRKKKSKAKERASKRAMIRKGAR
ncbi:MAG TPA: ABC transporter permease [Bacilli bacterium]|nr:ABC transporter permease [Bacilli bacterium]